MSRYSLQDTGCYLYLRLAVGNLVNSAAAAFGLGLASYREPARVEAMRTFRELKRGLDMGITPLEAIQLFTLVRATEKLGGCMAEVGVYQGGSARLIRRAGISRSLHLFDTFDEGMPEPAKTDTSVLWGPPRKGQFSCPLNKVKGHLGNSQNVYFHPGLFPTTGEDVKTEKFSFVHSDVGLFESTRGVLDFFYPRLVRGGIIISHDFATAVGVRQAFAEFFRDLPEPVIELPGNQGMVVKL